MDESLHAHAETSFEHSQFGQMHKGTLRANRATNCFRRRKKSTSKAESRSFLLICKVAGT
jgi:hypothetical protein